MPEWSNGAVSKTVVPFGAPGVRIPLSPQILVIPLLEGGLPGFYFQFTSNTARTLVLFYLESFQITVVL